MITFLEKNLPPLFCSFLLFLIAISEGKEALSWKPSHLLVFCIVGLGYYILNSMHGRNRLLLALALLVCMLLGAYAIPRESMVSFVKGYLSWLQTPAATLADTTWYLVLSISFLSVFSLCYQHLVEQFLPLRLLTALGLLVWMCVDLFTHRNLSHLATTCAFGYLLLTLVILADRHWEKNRCNVTRPYLLWLLPFLAVYIILMGLIPAPTKPYDWQFVRNLYRQLSQNLIWVRQQINQQNQERFPGSLVGFADHTGLSGNIMKEDQIEMYLLGPSSLQTNVYLVGKVYDDFSGNQWTNTNTLFEQERKLDTLETLNAVRLYDDANENDYIRSTTLFVQYENLQSRYLFAPLKTWKVTTDNLVYMDTGGYLLFEDLHGVGTSYQTHYLQLNVGHPLFYHLLDAPPAMDESVWQEVQKRYTSDRNETLTLDDLIVHRNNIHSLYTDSYTLSTQTRDILANITKDATSDIEKLRAIEAYLNTLEYTQTPGELPKHVLTPEAFLEYFLTESKRGYCSHFATAFVLMARAEGIPARYVEGFCIPISGNQQTPVYSSMAHAWPEVYLENIGWIPFEPTPGYHSIRYTPWEPVTPHVPQIVEKPSTEGTISTPESTPPADDSPMQKEDPIAFPTTLIAMLSVMLLCMAVLLFWASCMVQKHHYQKSDLSRKFQTQIHRNLQLLALLGYPRSPNETLTELQNRAQTVLSYNTNGSQKPFQFLNLYEEVLYNHRKADSKMLQQVLWEQKYLAEYLKQYKYTAYLYYQIRKNLGI